MLKQFTLSARLIFNSCSWEDLSRCIINLSWFCLVFFCLLVDGKALRYPARPELTNPDYHRFAWNLIFSVVYHDNVLYNVRGGLLTRFGQDPAWWMVYIATVAACILFDITLTTFRVAFWPTDVDIFQEFEKHPELRKRFEEEAAMELQQGWSCRDKKGKDREKV